MIFAIAYCESRFNDKAINVNKDGSKDFGLLQVNNKYHGKEATSLGLNLANPEQSLIMGLILLRRDGLSHWEASRKCLGNYAGQGFG